MATLLFHSSNPLNPIHPLKKNYGATNRACKFPFGSLSSTVLPEAHTASAWPQYKSEQVKVSLSY